MIGTKEYQKKFGAPQNTASKNEKAKLSSRVASMMTSLEAELLLEQFRGINTQLQPNSI